jgi:two-component system response regulator CpxR
VTNGKLRFLVVDVDHEHCETLRLIMEDAGYFVEVESDPEQGVRRSRTEPYSLLILDVELPDGFEVLRRIRDHSQMPILVLSAKADPPDRAEGLRAGADDYVAKPFHPDELLARIQALLRRAVIRTETPGALQIGELRLLPASKDVYLQGKPLELTAMEAEILECLMASYGKAVSRDRLSLRLYNRLSAPFERNIDTHVSRIRRKMGGRRTMILSVRGTGYQLRLPRGAEDVTLLHKPDESK